MHNYCYLEKYAETHFKNVRILDSLAMNDRYVFVALSYLRALDELAKENGTDAEIYKVEHCPKTGIPTLYTFFLSYVEDSKFNKLADRLYYELTRASSSKIGEL